MVKKAILGLTLLVALAALAAVDPQSLLDQILDPAVVQKTTEKLAANAIEKGMLLDPLALRNALLDTLDGRRTSNDFFKIGGTNIQYLVAAGSLASLVVKPQVLDRAYAAFALGLCRELQKPRISPTGTTLVQINSKLKADISLLNRLAAVSKTNEGDLVTVRNDVVGGTYFHLRASLNDLLEHYQLIRENYYLDRSRQKLSGLDPVFEAQVRKIEDLRIQVANAAYSGQTDFDLKLVEGLSRVESEMVKATFYIAGRKAYLLHVLGIIPKTIQRDSFGSVNLPTELEMTELTRGLAGFAVRRCVDAKKLNLNCSDTITKWKSLAESFSNLLTTNCVTKK